ncbi:MAG TPA: helix-turn-helix transcriptional regulator [Streptomyces sp.]|uniref:helix-turn-helix transcriptional regulator n=1 Tax=Streptomyces sp. TaxID=1931 RepID=UPI002D4703BD|nr:helix-turn-helix transcriptional regulator [Streptomyces sp.]HZG05684.1 helix-turn-helix transcriptional regulator [Streptomyces sp.]
MDREQLADFLRKRRAGLQPEDVGLPRGPRRRTGGLRREEVAALCGMSVDYYSRLEQRRGTRPSEQMLAAIARGLHLSLDERDHLFRLAGHTAPQRSLRSDHVDVGLMRVLDRLDDTPAQVLTGGLAETLVQTRLARALFGDETGHTGLDRSFAYRWFTRADARSVYPEDDHEMLGRVFVSQLRAAYAKDGPRSRAAEVVDALLGSSREFRKLWDLHEIGLLPRGPKRVLHPEVGLLELHCQVLHDLDQGQVLLVYTAVPGSESYEKLRLLSVLGDQALTR